MEYAIIIALVALCIWYAWRLYSLRKGIENLTAALNRDPIPSRKELQNWAYQMRLRSLSTVALDAVSEAELVRDSEQRQREFLEALLNEINDAIFILDSDRETRFVNEAARRLFPSEQDYQGRYFLDLVRDHRIFDTLNLADELGAKASDEIILRIPDASNDTIREIRVLVEAEPLSFPGENAGPGAWVLLRDITDQYQTEQIRRDFVANASHELRTPLSILNGYLESMNEPDADLNQAMFRRAVQTMRKHGERLSRIVDDMLAISKLENASELLTRTPFDMRDSIDDTISQLMPLIEEKHARIKVDADPKQSWTYSGDRYYWDQVFFNLIENALKQNREPGLHITISLEHDNGRLKIKVADDGIGIPSQDLPLIFKRFYRVQKHHSQNDVPGTGLGLSIVKRAVEAHGGKVSVESRPGVETAFTISVPEATIPVGAGAGSRK